MTLPDHDISGHALRFLSVQRVRMCWLSQERKSMEKYLLVESREGDLCAMALISAHYAHYSTSLAKHAGLVCVAWHYGW